MGDEAARAWLSDSSQASTSLPEKNDDSGAINWLNDGQSPTSFQPRKEQTPLSKANPIVDFGAAMTDSILDIIDIPNHLYNWAAEKLDLTKVPTVGDVAARELGMGYVSGEEPENIPYTAGKFTALGLEFMAPFLQIAKAPTIISGATTLPNLAAGEEAAKAASTLQRVSKQMVKPYVSTPNKALATDLAGGAAGGAGYQWGKERYGETGGQVISLAAGILPAVTIINAGKIADYGLRTMFPFTEAGGKARANEILTKLKQMPDLSAKIDAEIKQSLKGTKYTTAQLSTDEYISALEQVLIKEDPTLAREIKVQNLKNNAIAKMALERMSGVEGVDDVVKSMQSKTLKLKNYLNAKVDKSIAKVKDAIIEMSPPQKRAAANTTIREEIGVALKAARKDEEKQWNKVKKHVQTATDNVVKIYKTTLNGRWAEDDPAEIPKFLEEYLGKIDKKGKFVSGSYEKTPQRVGNLHALRRRIQKETRKETTDLSPDWNKVRMLEDMDDALLKDLEGSATSEALTDAIAFSRELNQKFKGGIMSTIMRNHKTGGSLDPSMTTDSLSLGEKGAVQISKLLDASPKSRSSVEDILKLNIIESNLIKNDRLDLARTKTYMNTNESIIAMFPDLKSQMERAISLEERASYFTGDAAAKIKKIENSLGFKISEIKNPKRLLTSILDTTTPEKSMALVYRQLNQKGKTGLKNDVFDFILNKSKVSSENLVNGTRSLSGKRAEAAWAENKKVLSIPLNKSEIKHIEKIVHTLKTGDKQTNLPVDVAEKAMETKINLLSYAVEVLAVRQGAKLGHGTHGASLKTASTAGNLVRGFFKKIGSNTATQLLKDAIQDPVLFRSIEEFPVSMPKGEKFFDGKQIKAITTLRGWMLSHVIEMAEESNQ